VALGVESAIENRQSKMISIVQLGTIDYATGLRLQQQLVALRKEEKIGDVLLLLEHSPVITLGRNAKAKNVVAASELLAQRGVELHECDRGGDVTFHGPGQIVGYPIFDLRGFACVGADAPVRSDESQTRPKDAYSERRHLGVVDFVRRLEDVLMRTCADFAIETKRIPGLTGVWTESESKLAAIGIHVSRFVTSHGFALNVNPDLSFFDLIIPCGISSKPVTSMQKELGRALNLNAVAESIARNFGAVFQSQILWLDSLDALLGRDSMQPAATSGHEYQRDHRART
jgi:lipoyl(octanoyl) transferase